MLTFKIKYLIEFISVIILIIILIYLPNNVQLILKDIFTKTAPYFTINTQDCNDIKIIKHFYPLKGELWTIVDSECISLNTNDLIVYKQQFIGRVTDKKGEYNTITPIYNKDVKLKIKLKTKDNKTIEGVYQGMDKNLGMIFYIPAQFNIENNAMVYTTIDKKNKIPENLMIGFIKERIIESNQTMTLMVNTNIELDILSKQYLNILSF